MTQPKVEHEPRGASPAHEGAGEGWREADRLAALERYAILDTPSETAFNDLAQLAADILGAPIAVINVIAGDRQWFKAEVGLGVRETPLDVSICRHLLLQDGVTVVPDLARDDRFGDNPLVTAAEGLRFYAGAVLRTPDGLPLGTLCVLDTVPRAHGVTERESRALATLAAQVMAQLELRRSEALARREGARAVRHARRVALLAQASERLLAAADAPAMLEGVFALLAPEFRLDAAFGFACGAGDFGLVASCGLTPEQARLTANMAFAETVCALVAERREAVHIADARRSEEPRAASVRALGLDAYYSAPLLADGALLGTLSFGRRGRGFSPGEIHVLSAVAGHMATAQRRLRAEGERAMLAQAVEQSSDLIGLADPSGRAFYLNEAGRRLVGLKDPEAVAGTRLADYVAPEDWAPLRAHIGSARDGQGRWAGAVRFRHFETGAPVPVHLSHFEVRDARGAPVALAVVARDTRERDRLVEAQRRSEARFRQLFESAGVGMILMDRECRIGAANAAFAAIAGRRVETLIGVSCLTFTHPDDVAENVRLMGELASGARASVAFEKRYQRPEGREVHVRLNITGLGDEQFLAVAEDVTARVEAQAARAASEARLAAIFDQAPAGLSEIAEDGRFLRVNDALCALLGRDREALLGLRVADVAHLDDLAEAEAVMARVVATGEPMTVEFRGQRPDGSEVWASTRASRLHDEAGGPPSLLAVTVDVDARVRATAALARRSEQLRELAQTALAVARAETLEDTLEVVTLAARRIAGAHQAVVSLTGGPDWSQAIDTTALTDESDARRGYEGAPDGSGIYAWACERNRPARMTQAELEAHPLWRGFGLHASEHPPLRGWLAAPLIGRDGRSLGLIQLSDKEDGAEFDAADEAMLVQLAHLASAAVEQTQAEAALRISEGRFRLVADSSPALIWVSDAEARITFANKRYEEVFGHPADHIHGEGWRRIVHPDDVEPFFATFLAALTARERFRADVRVLDRDGAVRWLHCEGVPHYAGDGRFAGYIGTNLDVTEGKAAEVSLRESEARLRAAVLASPFPTMLHAEDGEVLELSSQWTELTGYAREEIATHFDWARLAYPDLEDFAARMAAEFGHEGETATGEWRVRARDGRELVWDFRNVGLGRLPDGRRLQISAAADVTARKAAEEALREKAMEFEALAENVSQLAWMAEPDGQIFWYNKRWYDYTGTTIETMQGWGWRLVHHPDHIERILEEVQGHWARGEPFEDTYLLRSASGEFRPFLTRAEPIRDAEGRLLRWFGTNTDVTELLSLRETGERYRAIVESAREFAIVTLDSTGTISSWNIGAARLFGYHQDEAIGRSGSMLFTPEDVAAGAFVAEMRLAAEQGRAENERVHRRADGSRFWASGWVMPLLDRPGGAPIGFLKICQDRTERRRAEEHMRLMVNELNHRVKNSLATVQAIAQQTLLTSDGVERARGAITQRLQALADAHDVLTRESWEGADLRDVVEAALRPFAARDRARFDAGGPTVRLAPRMALSLNLALHELCTNAAKYGALAEPGGAVRIRWTAEAAGEGRRLRLEWRERGGPPVEGPPTRAGFGTRLIRMALAAEVEGRVAMAFEPEGLVCIFEATLE